MFLMFLMFLLPGIVRALTLRLFGKLLLYYQV